MTTKDNQCEGEGSQAARGFRPENLASAVSQFRPDGQIPSISETHFDGGQCRIYKATFDDGESWAVRVPLHVQGPEEFIILLFRTEQQILQEHNEKGFRWAPKLHGWSHTFDNKIRYPFEVLSWISGSPLAWTATSPPRQIRNKVINQVAEIQTSLINLTTEAFGPATEHFRKIISSKIARVQGGRLPNITEQDCHDQASLLPKVLHPELEHAPFALDHGDISASNLIVDSDHNIMGLIDWGFAAKVPMQMACRMPRLLQLEESVLPPDATLQEDRKAFVSSLKTQASPAALWLLTVHSAQDIDFRHFYLESLISKGMHEKLARLGWELPILQSSG